MRYVVDIYHNTPHEGLNGRTPLEQWEADQEDGNFPLRAAPTRRRKRLALGLPLTRVAQQDGIRVMNVQYHNEKSARWFLKHANKEVKVRWLDENIGSIEVQMDGVWQEVEAVSPIFHDVDASTWAAARRAAASRALRAKDGKRKEWEEGVIRRALDDIEALNAKRGAAYKIMDHAWSEKRLVALEEEAVANFTVVKDREELTTPARGRGRSIEPKAPEAMQAEPVAPVVEPAEPDAHAVSDDAQPSDAAAVDADRTPQAAAPEAAPKPKQQRKTKADPAPKKSSLKIEKDGDDEVWEFD